MAKVSSRNLKHIGPIVVTQLEKQNNRLIAAMIISLEENKNGLLAPIKKCMHSIKNNTECVNKIPEIMMKWEQDNNEILRGVDEKISKVLKITEDEVRKEDDVKVKKEEEVFGNNQYRNGLRKSSRIQIPKKIINFNSSISSDSSSDGDKYGDFDEDGYKSYDLILPSTKDNKFGADELKLVERCGPH
jgi:hypothetical protein